jgi:cation diffusion facilitator CzcD-associated flavoprotein CzcO
MQASPAKYHKHLLPEFGESVCLAPSKTQFVTETKEPGCKRLVVDAGWMNALHRENVELNFDDIASFTENGIITQKGKSFHLFPAVSKNSFDAYVGEH